MFDPVETLGAVLAEVQSMPDFLRKEGAIENAWLIAQKHALGARP